MFSEETKRKLDDIDKSILTLTSFRYTRKNDLSMELYDAITNGIDALRRENDFAIEGAKAEIFNEIYPQVRIALDKIELDYLEENKIEQIDKESRERESFNDSVIDFTNEMAEMLLREILSD